ncbi:MAG: hypothetical protein ABW007_09725 [Chitinophagaceae bacterium]
MSTYYQSSRNQHNNASNMMLHNRGSLQQKDKVEQDRLLQDTGNAPGIQGFSAQGRPPDPGLSRFGVDFSKVKPHSDADITAVNDQDSRIPTTSGEQGESVRQAAAGGSAAPAPAPAAGGSCGTPKRMVTVKSGAFDGGMTLGTYYPYLIGQGYWAGNNAGPFDTGTRVGSSIQLYGLVPSPCIPSQYTFRQTFQDTLLKRNGTTSPTQGQVIDDFARSGQNQASAPFRQLFLDTVGAEGLAISMGDPPSEPYGPTDNLEWDCSYVTSLAGPSGAVSASWSTSVRVVNGAVTRNTLS